VTLYAAGLPMRAYPTEHGELRRRIARGVHRSYYPAGTARQLLAIIASGDRRPLLGKIAAPTLVIHGADDPLVPVAAGRDTAQHIKGARLMVIDGMAHDLPPGLLPTLVEAIASHCKQVRVPPAKPVT
jgi:pimeloyl-ACP methyl ester carboxylesterase